MTTDNTQALFSVSDERYAELALRLFESARAHGWSGGLGIADAGLSRATVKRFESEGIVVRRLPVERPSGYSVFTDSKIDLLLHPPAERLLLVDADAIVTGNLGHLLESGIHVELDGIASVETYLKIESPHLYRDRATTLESWRRAHGADEGRVLAVNAGMVAGDMSSLMQLGQLWQDARAVCAALSLPALETISFSNAVAALRTGAAYGACQPSCSGLPGEGRWNFDARRCVACARAAVNSFRSCAAHAAAITHFIGVRKGSATPRHRVDVIHRSDLMPQLIEDGATT